jgi:hypothetical protein
VSRRSPVVRRILTLAAIVIASVTLVARAPVVIKSAAGFPIDTANRFEQPIALQPAPDGAFYVFDRRAHTVYRIDRRRTLIEPLVKIGAEAGRLLRPSALSAAADGSFAVADAPLERERVQIFNAQGQRVAGFELPSRSLPRVTLDSLVLNGVGTLTFTGLTGRRVLISQPEHGSSVTEYDLYGQPQRTIGALRPTGHESDPQLHIAMNAAIPLAAPDGGFWVVFQTGRPMFRRYDAKGVLLFERRIEGRELDRHLAALPSVWPRRQFDQLEIPLVAPTVRAAALDEAGHLWLSFVVPVVYEYDEDGDKLRSVQLQAAGAIAPTSLAFAPNGRLFVTPGLYEFDVSPSSPASR